MTDKRSPEKPQETDATTEVLMDHYNAQCEPYNALIRVRFAGDDEKIEMLTMLQIPCIELVVSREVLIERIRRQNYRLGRHVKDRAHELLLTKVADEAQPDGLARKDGKYTVGLTYQQILQRLAIEFPESSTSVACLRWYTVHMKGDAADEGLAFPDLPQYRPRSSAPKKAA